MRKLTSPIDARCRRRGGCSSQVIDFYHETLKQSPDALTYLKKRGLAHPEMVEPLKLGFANRTLGYRLPQ